MKHFSLILVSGIILMFSTNIKAQSKQNSLEFQPQFGLHIFSSDRNLMAGNFYGGEMIYHLNMINNESDWVRMMHVRQIDFSFCYNDMNDISLTRNIQTQGFLGVNYGISTGLSLSLLNVGKTNLSFLPGFGIGYASQTFYTNNNPIVGSHINFTAQAGFKILTPINSLTRLALGIKLYHYSNAAVKLPNDGVNSLNVTIGIDHDLNTESPKTSQKILKDDERNTFEFGINVGRRGLVQTGNGITESNSEVQKNATSHLYKSGLYAGYVRRINPILGLKLGTDVVYYYTVLDTGKQFYATYQELASSYDRWRVGITTGADLYLGRIACEFNVGRNLHFNYFTGTYGYNPNPSNWYWTVGCKYSLNRWLALEAKQYFAKIEDDYLGVGLVFKVR